MKIKNILLLSIIGGSFLSGCAAWGGGGNNNLQTVVDPSYNFIFENTNKLAQNSFVNFKVTKVSNGVIDGVLTNNIYNLNSDVLLFKIGDKISIKYTNLGAGCSFNNARLYNYKDEDTELNGFLFLDGSDVFSCNSKSGTIGLTVNDDIYTIQVLTSNAIPVLNGVAVPNILDTPSADLYSMYKVITPNQNISWLPKKIVDNGIQTYIEFPRGSVSESDRKNIMVYNNLGGYKVIHINYNFYKNGILVDGVYNNLSVINSTDGQNKGEISILRNNIPNDSNSLVEKLYSLKENFYKQDKVNQQGSVVSAYQSGNNTQSPQATAVNQYNKSNQPNYSEDMVIAKANQMRNQTPSNPSVITSQNKTSGGVPPIGGKGSPATSNNAPQTQIFSVSSDNSGNVMNNQQQPLATSNEAQPVDAPTYTTPNSGMGVSIMGQLGF